MVIVGSVAYDGLETPHGKIDRILGGSCTYVALSASYFCDARIVGVIGDDFAQEDYNFLVSHGIDVKGLERAPGKTFFWAGRYTDDMNDRVTLTTDLNVFADFNPKLPPEWLSSECLFLGNIQPALQRTVREQMPNAKLVGGDTMNLWINIAKDELLKTIAQWDFLLINDSEARLLAGEQNLRKAACKIIEMGPHTVVIKRGEHGALLWRRDGHFMVPGYLLEDVFDPTGAGDCFAGGFMGYLAGKGISLEDPDADHNEIRRAVIYGSVMGSFCCERFGPERFRTLTREEIDARFEEFRQFTAF
jgi:sugar/nucleoside kinase (ribokinase family)